MKQLLWATFELKPAWLQQWCLETFLPFPFTACFDCPLLWRRRGLQQLHVNSVHVNTCPDSCFRLAEGPHSHSRREMKEALTSILKARGLWYLVSPAAPLPWAWPPLWLWLWGSTPRSCPRRHSSSSLWTDCEWRGGGRGAGGGGGRVKEAWTTGTGYRVQVVAAVMLGGEIYVRWFVDKTDKIQQTVWGGWWKKTARKGGGTKIILKMGKKYKQRRGEKIN